jgi:hypothetical protein
LNEFAPVAGDLIVVVEGATGPELLPLGDLLPRSFGPRDLGVESAGGGQGSDATRATADAREDG